MFDDYAGINGGMSYGCEPEFLYSDARPAQSLTSQEQAFMRLRPELFFASELFQGRYVRRRRQVRNYEARSICPARTVRYTGERLDQFDLDVLLVCALHCSEQCRSAPGMTKIDIRGIAKVLLKTASKTALPRVAASLRRLESCRVEVRDGRFVYCLRPVQKVLIDTMEQRCLVELNPEMLRSLQSIHNFSGFVQERLRLRMRSIDRWLHGLLHYSSEVCIPFGGFAALSGNAAAQTLQVVKSLDRLRCVVRPDEIGVLEGCGLEIHRDAPVAGGPR
ncbi:MAG: hypothetical protein P4L39_04350 [Humidesulfovibrio sp.]|nr:hypothetical protein [Humidesulfovibrio sp.]